MRSLLIGDIVPTRPATGGVLRLLLVARTLAEYGPVDAVFLTRDQESATVDDGGVFDRCAIVPVEPEQGLGALGRYVALGPVASYYAHHRRVLRQRRLPWLVPDGYGLVWYSRERVWTVARHMVDAPTVVDVDDFEDMLIRRWLALGRAPDGGPVTRLGWLHARRDLGWWRRLRRRTARKADVLVLASDHDRTLARRHGVVVVPNTYQPDNDDGAVGTSASNQACDADATAAGAPGRPPTVLLQGSLTWSPNVDAAMWLVHEIAPLIRHTIPELRVRLVGRASEEVRALADPPRVFVTGEVVSMTGHLRDADIVMVPLRVGAGTRIKILEAFAYGVPVVASTIGAEGLDVIPGVHLAIGDTADELAAQCVTLLRNPAAAQCMSGRAAVLYRERYRPESARAQVRLAVSRALGRRTSSQLH